MFALYICISDSKVDIQHDIYHTVYHDYQMISESDFYEKIRFYESNFSIIESSPEAYRLELSLQYVEALYVVEAYYDFLLKVDDLIIKVVEDNIVSVDGHDLYQELLYMKAIALYHTLDYIKSDKVLTDLVRIDPEQEEYKQAYIKNQYGLIQYNGQKNRGASIALFLLTAIIIGIELLVVKPFHSEIELYVQITRWTTFALGISSMIGYELYSRIQSQKKHKNIISK